MQPNFSQKWGELIAKVARDENLKKRLLNNPHQVLEQHGIHLPEHMKISIKEGATVELVLTIPTKIEGRRQLSPEELKRQVGGCQNCSQTY